MDYDALQYCDFLGSICSIWVTILCMARLGDTAKYVRGLWPFSFYNRFTLQSNDSFSVLTCSFLPLLLPSFLVGVQTLFLLGALLIAMSMQLDRKGLWNLLGPILCAILLMVTSWVRDTSALTYFVK